jgi:dTDP-4-amino-4,6-dideoxygalactose transaminase
VDDSEMTKEISSPTVPFTTLDAPAEPREVPFARPWFDEDDIARVVETVRSGWVMQGPRVTEFEELFAATVTAPSALAISSCTAGLHLALLVLGIGPGDIVVTVSHSFIATANVVRMCGAEPVFVDIDPVSLNMSPEALERCLERDFENIGGGLWYGDVERLARGESPLAHLKEPRGRLAAVLVPHQVGMPADMTRILAVADRFGVPVVEDAACALGSYIIAPQLGRSVPIGYPLGRIVCFSLHPRKVISTGEGGMITSAHADLMDRVRMLRQHGMTRSTAERHGDPTLTAESYPICGYNYRLTDVQAALGIGQLRRLDRIIARRRAIADRYRTGLGHLAGLTLPADPPFGKTNYQSYVMRVDGPGKAQELMRKLHRKGIATRFGIMCAHREPPYSEQWAEGSLPESERARDECLILPLFPTMTDSEAEYVARTTARLLG